MDFSRIADVQGSDFGAVFANIFFAVVELVFGVGDNAVNHVTQPAAGFFLIVALMFVWSIVRFELRHRPAARHKQ